MLRWGVLTPTHRVAAHPVFTSANTVAFLAGEADTYDITVDAFPDAAFTFTGALPSGVGLVDNGDNSATLSGVAALTTGGVYHLTVKASNGV